jgi:hypothetical protein
VGHLSSVISWLGRTPGTPHGNIYMICYRENFVGGCFLSIIVLQFVGCSTYIWIDCSYFSHTFFEVEERNEDKRQKYVPGTTGTTNCRTIDPPLSAQRIFDHFGEKILWPKL